MPSGSEEREMLHRVEQEIAETEEKLKEATKRLEEQEEREKLVSPSGTFMGSVVSLADGLELLEKKQGLELRLEKLKRHRREIEKNLP